MWALLNDLFQRLVTLNKLEQRRHLLRRLQALNLTQGSKGLDFGCGTALFAPTLRKAGLRYYGYDVDERLLTFARRLYRDCMFVSAFEPLRAFGPFDLILANCCFHHIADDALTVELRRMKELLRDGGTLLVIDLLLCEDDPSFLRRQFQKLERGAYVRRSDDYRRLIERQFRVKRLERERSHVWSLNRNPLHQDMVVFECGK
jgi:SAM-dependent methyltransferase